MTELADAPTQTLVADDGRRIPLYLWEPAGSARALVQILHGMSEHAGRYERFALALTQAGYAVVAHDHRGHDADDDGGFFAERDGWAKVVGDAHRVLDAAQARWQGLPTALFGHSMGSYVAQACVMRRPDSVQALVLSGSTSAPRLQLWLGRFAAAVEAWRHGRRHASEALNAQAFGAFNKRFAPARTDFDWLSRDPGEVDRYVEDPRCGGVPTAGLWQDLLGGLIEIGRDASLARVPAGLPILITGGGDDPVGGRRGMQALAERYRQTGHERVRLAVFDDARHEMLNETNRDEFVRLVVDWLDAALEPEYAAAAGRA